MGFLPQFYIIKDALLHTTGLNAKNNKDLATLPSPIISIKGASCSTIYTTTTDPSTSYALSCCGIVSFASSITAGSVSPAIDNDRPFTLYLSEDHKEDKLIVDNLDHLISKAISNCAKSFENGKVYANITYTNSGADFEVSTVRIAIKVYTNSNTTSIFMIYSESIDPITIGTGETVQIKIEV